MSALREGIERAEARMARVGETGELVPVADAIPLTCVGTDVLGPELAKQIAVDADGLILRAAAGDDLGMLLRGGLARWFWLGYEMRGED